MKNTSQKADSDFYNIAPCYFFSFSNEGFITQINSTFLRDLGYTEEEVIHKMKFTELLTVGSRIFYQTHFFPLIRLHGKFNEIFLSFLSRDKEEFPALLNVVLTGHEDAFEIQGAGIQITQRNRFEKEILEAKHVAQKALLENAALVQLRSELESNQELLEMRLQKLSHKNNEQQQINMIMSHDLQEPLRKISIFSNLLLMDKEVILPEKAAETFQKINGSVIKIRELVLNIQSYLALNEKPFHLAQMNLDDALNEAFQKAGIKNGDPRIELNSTPLPSIRANQTLIVELFYQLLTNSIKFKDKTKNALLIKISSDYIEQNIFVELENKYKYREFLRITYADNGIGFDNSLAEEIFVLFRKGHDRHDGSGMGLAYCKKITELHHGFISAKSESGNGAVFTLLLPAFENEQ